MDALLHRAMMEVCICSVKNKIKSLVKVGMSNIMSGMFSKNSCVAFVVFMNCAMNGSFTGKLERNTSCDEKRRIAQKCEMPNYGVPRYTPKNKEFFTSLVEKCKFPVVIAQLAVEYAAPTKFCYNRLWLSAENPVISCLSLIDGGRHIAIGDELGCIKLWNVAEERLSKTFATNVSGTNTMGGFDLSALGYFAEAAYRPETIEMTSSGHAAGVNAFADLNNGRFASGSHDSTIKIWNILTDKCLDTFIGHTKSVQALELLPSGELASIGTDGIRVWDLTTRQCKRIICAFFDFINNMGCRHIAFRELGGFSIYNMLTNTVERGFYSEVNYVLRVNDNLVISCDRHQGIKFWNVATKQPSDTIKMKGCITLGLSSDEKLLVGCVGRKIAIIDLETKKCVQELSVASESLDDKVITGLVVLPDGRFVASCDDGSVHMFSQE
jgi:WD40 repeat protein